MRREKKPKSRRTVLAVTILGCLVWLAGWGAIIYAAVMQNRGYEVNADLTMLCFIGLSLLAVFLFYRVIGDAYVGDVQKLEQKYSALALSSLEGLTEARLGETFRRQGFHDTGEGCLERKFFTLAKDSIRYYVRMIPTLDVTASLEAELQRMHRMQEEDGGKETKKSLCLYLFLRKSGVTEADQQALREASKSFLIQETAIPASVFQTCLPILVDETTGEGRYLDMSKGISVYAHACRRLKRYFPL